MSSSVRHLCVESPGRLHLGFVDLNGSLGRKFGSLGLALDDLSTVVTVQKAESFRVEGMEAERAAAYARAVCTALGVNDRIALNVVDAIPAHAGLGSGTQLALTVAVAIAKAHRVAHKVRELAALTGRGQRSGIGVGVFESGGFVIDGGQASSVGVPPLLARFDFPSQWRVILIEDLATQGLSGVEERAAFEHIEPMPESDAAQLCRLTLMGLFPALVDHDFDLFSRAIAGIQRIIGAYFAPYQGGPYASEAVAAAVLFTEQRYALNGTGQSSWGPTGFVFVPHEEQGQEILAELRRRYADRSTLRFSLRRGRNHGARVEQRETRSTTEALG